MLSIATDYARSTGCPEADLRHIAAAGFTHVHWCHQWNTDFLYASSEIAQIRRWLRECGLAMLDMHASSGSEKCWSSPVAYERLAGVELVQNRLEMAAALECDVIVMHIPCHLTDPAPVRSQRLENVCRSLDEVAPRAQALGVRIAIENMPRDDFAPIRALCARYGADTLGLCYDAGHGHISGDGLAHLATLQDRLLAIHLHDNDADGDRHWLPFMGTVAWERLAEILAASAYAKCVNLEVSMALSGYDDDETFLRAAHACGEKLAGLIDAAKAREVV